MESRSVESVVVAVDDVAAAIVDEHRRQFAGAPLTAMKLQKLVYYAQAVSLATRSVSLFDDAIEAWKDGPMVRVLYDQHRGLRRIQTWPSGDSAAVPTEERQLLSRVVRDYGRYTGEQLSEATHSELPWRAARGNTPPGESSNHPLDRRLMATFYARMFTGASDAVVATVTTLRLEGLPSTSDDVEAFRSVATGDVDPDAAVVAYLASIAG